MFLESWLFLEWEKQWSIFKIRAIEYWKKLIKMYNWIKIGVKLDFYKQLLVCDEIDTDWSSFTFNLIMDLFSFMSKPSSPSKFNLNVSFVETAFVMICHSATVPTPFMRALNTGNSLTTCAIFLLSLMSNINLSLIIDRDTQCRMRTSTHLFKKFSN